MNKPVLTLSPTAYLHWQFLCQQKTEVTAFGVSSETDSLYVSFLYVPEQECSSAYTDPADGAIGEAAEWCLDNDIAPHRVGKIWLHTHPEMSATPSHTDESTFKDTFAQKTWAVMAILSKTGDESCRLRFNGKEGAPSGDWTIPIAVDWASIVYHLPHLSELHVQWEKELAERVTERVWAPISVPSYLQKGSGPYVRTRSSDTQPARGLGDDEYYNSYADKVEVFQEKLVGAMTDDEGEELAVGTRVGWKTDGELLTGDIIEIDYESGMCEVLPDNSHDTDIVHVDDLTSIDGYNLSEGEDEDEGNHIAPYFAHG